MQLFKGHPLSITCLATSSDDNYIYSGSKDGTIIKCNKAVFLLIINLTLLHQVSCKLDKSVATRQDFC